MPDVILRILSMIGIVLLILLGLVLLLLLLVLFWPVAYRVKGMKDSERLQVTARADWLFGVFRVRYAYPEPGSVTVRLLWKTLFDTGQKKEDPGKDQQASTHKEDSVSGEESTSAESSASAESSNGPVEANTSEESRASAESSDGPEEESRASAESSDAPEEESNTFAEDGDSSAEEPGKSAENSDPSAEEDASPEKFAKIKKIKYTILKIYDKIKEIWANISYYTALLQEEDTALLWGHVKLRLGKIWKSIRPRSIRADVLFGTGAPDTTGYAFGLCCMLLPVLGRRVCVTPDFERKVLEGDLDVSGHITVWTLLWNALKLLLDKKLKLFMKKMKAGRKENGR